MLLLDRKADRALIHTLQPNWTHILVDLIEAILEAFDVQFSHQGAEFDDAGDGDADADFERGP